MLLIYVFTMKEQHIKKIWEFCFNKNLKVQNILLSNWWQFSLRCLICFWNLGYPVLSTDPKFFIWAIVATGKWHSSCSYVLSANQKRKKRNLNFCKDNQRSDRKNQACYSCNRTYRTWIELFSQAFLIKLQFIFVCSIISGIGKSI